MVAFPVAPILGYSFTSFSTTNPAGQQPGAQLDAEFNRADAAIGGILTALAVSLNADGTLKSSAVDAAITAGGGGSPDDFENVSDAPAALSALLAQAWAEHMPDELPADTLAGTGITGDHWSSRWWANQAAVNVQNQQNALLEFESQISAAASVAADQALAGLGFALADTLLLRSYGYIGDGRHDDAYAIQAVCDAFANTNLLITFPSGTTKLGRQIISRGSASVALKGAGQNHTILEWTNPASNGWNHGQGTAGAGTFQATDLYFKPPVTGGGTGLRVSVDVSLHTTNPSAPALLIRGCLFGSFGNAPSWNVGIAAFGCDICGISDTSIFLQAPTANNTGFVWGPIEGTAIGSGVTVQMSCNNLTIQGGTIGIDAGNSLQGLLMNNCNLQGMQYGVRWLGTINEGTGGLQITNCQMNCSIRNVLAQFCTNVFLSGNFFLQFDGNNVAAAYNWAAIELAESGLNAITGNFILSPGVNVTSNVAAIYVHGGSVLASGGPGIITGNTTLTNNKASVELAGAVSGVKVTNNNFWNAPANSNQIIQTPSPAWAQSTVYAAQTSVSNGGLSFTTTLGGTSAATGSGPAAGALTDGTVTWSNKGPSLDTFPNEVWGNSTYGMFDFSVRAGGADMSVGRPGTTNTLTIPTGNVVLPKTVEVGNAASTTALVDFHSSGSANDYDVRAICTGGTSGTNGVGSLQLVAGKLGFFTTVPIARPAAPVTLADVIAVLQNYGLTA